MAVLAWVFHAQVHRRRRERARQGEDVRVRSDDLLLRVFERFFKRRAGLKPHAAGDARLARADDVDGAGVHLRNVAAGHHREAVERVERIGEAILADVFLVRREILAVAVHIRQGLHVVVLEHFIQFSQVRPALVMEIAVADARHDEHAMVGEDALVADDLRGERLHHLNRVGAHAVAVVEVRRHAEYDDIILLLCPVDVGALVRQRPGDRLHLLRVAGEDGNLAALAVQHRVAAEELLAHLLFHEHALLIELVAHLAVGGDGHEVRAVHDLRNVVRRDGTPMGNARGAVLIAAGVTAVGIALRMADENRHVRVIDVFIHDDVVAVIRVAEIDKVVVIFAVVAGDLAGIIELVKQFVAQNGLHLRHARARVQTVGEQQQNILLFHARRIQLVDARADRDLAVAGRLVAALDDIRDDNDDGAALMRQLGKRLHTNRVANALERFRIERIPVLRQAFGVGHGLARHKDIGVVRQIGAHQALPIFKIKLHLSSPFLGLRRAAAQTCLRDFIPQIPPSLRGDLSFLYIHLSQSDK